MFHRLGLLALTALLALVAIGCATTSAADIKLAHEARYNTDFLTVWKACDDAIHDRYEKPQIQVEDPSAGRIVTQWKLVEAKQEDLQTVNGAKKSGSSTIMQGTMMRMMVVVKGPAPFQVLVDGEAAEYRHDLAVLTPYKHGAEDEPQYVPGRIGALEVDIYNRLKQYVVPAGGAAPAAAPAPAVAPASQPASAPAK
jgi:hypothetical protein